MRAAKYDALLMLTNTLINSIAKTFSCFTHKNVGKRDKEIPDKK